MKSTKLFRFYLPVLGMILFCGWVCIHFVMTALYVMPLNPIKMLASPVVTAYIQPLFTQNWHLFAPDPIDESRILTVACKAKDSLGANSATPKESEWHDASTLLRKQFQRNRISAAERLNRVQSTSIQVTMGMDDLVLQLARKRTPYESDYNKALDKMLDLEQESRKQAQVVLYRVASWTCGQLYGNEAVSEVRFRIVTHRFPRFSQRLKPDTEGEISAMEFGWQPFQYVGGAW